MKLLQSAHRNIMLPGRPSVFLVLQLVHICGMSYTTVSCASDHRACMGRREFQHEPEHTIVYHTGKETNVSHHGSTSC